MGLEPICDHIDLGEHTNRGFEKKRQFHCPGKAEGTDTHIAAPPLAQGWREMFAPPSSLGTIEPVIGAVVYNFPHLMDDERCPASMKQWLL